MTSINISLEHHKLKNHLVALSPYAFISVCPNRSMDGARSREAIIRQLEAPLRELFVRADRKFLGCRDIVRKRSALDRFQGLFFHEKLDTNPHTHICLFSAREVANGPNNGFYVDRGLDEKELRLRFLTEHLATNVEELSDTGQRRQADLLKNLLPGASCDVQPIDDPDRLASYVTKQLREYHAQRLQSFDYLSKFHSADQKR